MIEQTLNLLCNELGPRPAGSAAHARAAQYIQQNLERFGFRTEVEEYPCPDWTGEVALLSAQGDELPCLVNTFSPPCEVSGELVWIHKLPQICDLDGKIAVLHGEPTREAFFPRNFTYFRDEAKDEFLNRLDDAKPAAIITVSHRSDHLIPIIEDSDLHIPSITISSPTADVLRRADRADLLIASHRRMSAGRNIIAKKGAAKKTSARLRALRHQAHYRWRDR